MIVPRPSKSDAAGRWDRLAILAEGMRLRGAARTMTATTRTLRDVLPDRSGDFSYWSDFVAFSSSHAVVPVLASALVDGALSGAVDDDITDYVLSMEEANAKRNFHLAEGLYEVAARLNHVDVVPVVAKGGAFLAHAIVQEDLDQVRWRFLSDIDIYVSAHELFRALETLFQAGFVPSSQMYDPDRMAHYPPLISPCGTYSIEVHTRLFAQEGAFASVADLRTNGGDLLLGDARIQVPSAQHRLGHLVAHAQLHNRFYPLKRMFLRDMADLLALYWEQADTTGDLDLPGLLELFPENAEREAVLSFFALSDLILPDAVGFDRGCLSDGSKRWAYKVVGRYLLSARQHQLLSTGSLVTHEFANVFLRPGGWRRLGGVFVAPWRLAEWFQNERRRSQSIR